jgi:hypothetical protein
MQEPLERYLTNAFSGYGELRAAYSGEGGGDRCAWMQFLPYVSADVGFLGFKEEIEVSSWAIQVNPIWAPGGVVAPERHVA